MKTNRKYIAHETQQKANRTNKMYITEDILQDSERRSQQNGEVLSTVNCTRHCRHPHRNHAPYMRKSQSQAVSACSEGCGDDPPQGLQYVYIYIYVYIYKYCSIYIHISMNK